ncbi:glycosyltransferase family 39 protein [Rhizobium tumorigenes]|uniref:Glycosyltransferase family 39 protein n=1 Tax=Rhizobium tumorigenes TaxID=2041385 RepID=A0AAF1K665_9HYPH|nr:glycosyltransferase family 39 protein [Rhizobium tumorigenes]WFR96455.1 glycosyltransferase family 39 protein [Rhizobium tumorigenes]
MSEGPADAGRARGRSGMSLRGLLARDAPLGTRIFWIACVAITLLGLALRLPNLATRSLWLDEAYTAWFAALPLRALWTEVPLYETHPPMYYTLLKGWTMLFGNSEAALRMPSVLASVATILLVTGAGRVLNAGPRGDRIALLAALLLAINAGSINYAQQARPYALETFAASIAVLSALILLQRLRAGAEQSFLMRPLVPPMAALGLSTAATMWLHDTGILVALGIWAGLITSLLVFVPGRRAGQALAVALPGVVALLLWSPFLPMFIRQNSGMASLEFWITFSPWDLLTAWFLVAGGYLPFIPAVLLFLAGMASVWRNQRPLAALVLVVVFLPWATMLAISYFIKPVYIDRLFEWMAPTVLGLIAIGMLARSRWASLRLVTVVLFIGMCLMSTNAVYHLDTEDWRGLVASIAADAEPGDLVIASPNELDAPLRYYIVRTQPFPDLMVLPAPFPALGLPRVYVSNRGAPKIMPEDRQQVRAALETHRRVWLIERATDLYDPQGLMRAEIMTSRHKISSRISDSISLDLFE